MYVDGQTIKDEKGKVAFTISGRTLKDPSGAVRAFYDDKAIYGDAGQAMVEFFYVLTPPTRDQQLVSAYLVVLLADVMGF